MKSPQLTIQYYFFRLSYIILFTLYNLYCWFSNTFHSLLKYRLVNIVRRVYLNDQQLISQAISSYKQMPIHIGLVLDSKVLRSQLKKENVVDILSWCVYSGIQYITVHDHEGQLKADFTVYTEELRKTNGTVMFN